MKSGTIKELLEYNKGTAPGFDALRLLLASIVLLFHTSSICYGAPFGPKFLAFATHPLVLPFIRGVLPAFFCLGGFLVTGSAYRLRSVGRFLFYRALRIVPALFVEVILSAFILGAIVTTLPLSEYFTSPKFFLYFLNVVGWIHYMLPGVFAGHTIQAVNANLWTLPPDLHGYAILAVLIGTGIIFNRRVFLSIFAIASVFLLLFLPMSLNWGSAQYRVSVPAVLLIYSFFLGAAGYVFSDRIRIDKRFMALGVLSLFFFDFHYTTLLAVLGACYVTLCIGFMDLRNFPLIRRGDYSYGVYLYGFPIQQTLWHYLPALREWWSLALVSLPLAMLFAMFSWHFIEEPARSLKSRVSFLKGPK